MDWTVGTVPRFGVTIGTSYWNAKTAERHNAWAVSATWSVLALVPD